MRVDLPWSTLPAVLKRSRSFCCSCARNCSILNCSAVSRIAAILEIPLALLQLHRPVLIVVDDAIFPLRFSERDQLFNDLGNGIRIRPYGTGAGRTAQGSHAAPDQFRLLARQARDEI